MNERPTIAPPLTEAQRHRGEGTSPAAYSPSAARSSGPANLEIDGDGALTFEGAEGYPARSPGPNSSRPGGSVQSPLSDGDGVRSDRLASSLRTRRVGRLGRLSAPRVGRGSPLLPSPGRRCSTCLLYSIVVVLMLVAWGVIWTKP